MTLAANGDNLGWPRGSYCCVEGGFSCMCGIAERGLRQFIESRALEPMTPEQRAWAIAEVAAVEGYTAADCAGLDDADLARLVLAAWTDFCRDKGMV